jgi:hypothetical protein
MMPNVTQNRMAAIAFRWSITAVFALWVFALSAPAQPIPAAKLTSITGVYNGTYAGEQGPIKFKLSVTQQDNGTLAGTFTLYLPDGADTTAYTCDVRGRYIPANRMVQVVRGKWETPPPAGIDMPGMNGVFDPDGANGAGQISGKMRSRPGPKFEAIRDADESAKLAAANAANKPAEPPAQPPAGAAATASPSSRPPGAYIRPTEIDGVYAGTYGSNPDDKVPAKLSVKFINNGSVNGILDGLFTFDVPPSPGAKSITYTYKLIGVYAVGQIQFWSAKPLGNPAPDAYALTQINAEFDKTPPVKAPNGQVVFYFNPDQITGKVIGSNGRPGNNKIEAKRDKDESAKLDSVMAAQASAAGAVVSPTPPAAAPPAAPAVAPGARVVRPGIVGVFNGTYTRANEPPTKLKLTITQVPDGLAGVATIYLPTDSGTKAYTYSLKGALDGRGAFHLLVYDWETTPPKDFKNFKAMGFNGTFLSNLNQNTARIVSAPTSGLATFVVPKFEATWDATESADIKGAIAAQKAVDAADQVAAMKARDEILKNAQPKQLASNDLVRKSKAYWDGYETDMIREVFDGGFGAGIDENREFEEVFVTYLEMLSAKFPDCLPANHQRVTNIVRTNRKFDKNGILLSEEVHDYTIDMDPRFVDKYKQFFNSLNSKGEEIRGVIAAAQPGGAQRMLHGMFALASGMQKFFADHGGKSAATHQLNENLLRGATGEPSLQQADGKIEGAQAESDKDLPPGRYARFVDGANAYFRELAKRDPIKFGNNSSHDTALCQRLAELYEFHMSREEDYYYANDFEGRFLPIMGPRASCPDPAWPQLHPDVEKAIEEVK